MVIAIRSVQELRIVVPGPPVAQGRARASLRGGRIRMHDPESSAAWKTLATVRMEAEARRTGWSLDGPMLVVVDAIFERIQRLKGGERVPKDTKPDGDNLLKASLDAGNGVLWADDGQVVEATVRKWWAAPGERPAVYVVVLNVGGES